MSKSAPKYVLMIGPALSAPGGMSAVVSAYREAGLFAEWNVRYINSFELPGVLTQLRVMARSLLAFIWLLLAGKVALVHVHSASRGSFWRKALFCWIARLFRRPYVFHIHSGEFPLFFHKECGPFAQKIVRYTLEHSSTVIALTKSWEEPLAAIAPNAKIITLGNFVVVGQRLQEISLNQQNVLFLGRLREKKGVFDLVKAIPEILMRLPNVKFILAGDGDLEAIRLTARSLGVEDSVVLPGWVDGSDKDQLLKAASLLVLPSYFEGLPICILEAMATGIPVVSTRVGGIPEVLDHGECGILLEPGDVSALARAIILLLSDTHVCERIRSEAFIRVEKFYSSKVIISTLSKLYDFILYPQEAHDA